MKHPIAWVMTNQSGQTYTLLGTILSWHRSRLDDQRDLFHWWFLQLSNREKMWVNFTRQCGCSTKTSPAAPAPTSGQGAYRLLLPLWHVRDPSSPSPLAWWPLYALQDKECHLLCFPHTKACKNPKHKQFFIPMSSNNTKMHMFYIHPSTLKISIIYELFYRSGLVPD